MRIASIDIGTNSILLTIADVFPDGNFRHLLTLVEEPRLGENLDITGEISHKPFSRALDVLRQFTRIAKEQGAVRIHAFGTHVFRRATNGKRIAQELSNAVNIDIKILSTEEEARFAFIGATTDILGGKKTVIDVGGGSTEIVRGETFPDLVFSIPIGALNVTERFIDKQPLSCEALLKIRSFVDDELKRIPIEAFDGELIGVGGTITTLGGAYLGLDEYIPSKIHHLALPRDAVRTLADNYPSMTIVEIKATIPFAPNRASIISAGAIIVDSILTRKNTQKLIISDFGARLGYIFSTNAYE